MRLTKAQVTAMRKFKDEITEEEIELGSVTIKTRTMFWQSVEIKVERLRSDLFLLTRHNSYCDDVSVVRGDFREINRVLNKWYGRR